MQKFNINDLNSEFKDINEEITTTATNLEIIRSDESKIENELNDLLKRVERLAKRSGLEVAEITSLSNKLELFNLNVDEYLFENNKFVVDKAKRLVELNNIDIVICSVSSILSILIDVIFVGTPEIVKVYKGGENFDGSILTEMLRKIGNTNDSKIAPLLQWFSDKCKVPYDISAYKGTVTPNNHRLRSFGHDPLFGLMFAVADIILGTTTCVDNSGQLKILVNKRKAPTSEKWLAVIYYLGHLISDVCTARGLPIPGFCSLQFFQTEIVDKSIAKIAENMYLDGYDLRHMVSMGIPVFINEMIIKIYCEMSKQSTDTVFTIAEMEKVKLDNKLKEEKMRVITNTAATLGNAVKFIAPPSCGNPTAINMVQWLTFLQSGIVITKAGLRDISVEEVMYSREEIDKKWDDLLS